MIMMSKEIMDEMYLKPLINYLKKLLEQKKDLDFEQTDRILEMHSIMMGD